MRGKLKLNPEQLRVESFAPEQTPDEGGGSVRGHQSGWETCPNWCYPTFPEETCVDCPTLAGNTCERGYDTCRPTCVIEP